MPDTKKGFYISVANDFSPTPGGRFRSEGPFSGEEFLHKLLVDNYFAAMVIGEPLVIDLDGCMGFPPSFIDGSFGELARHFSDKNIFDVITLVSQDDPDIPVRIQKLVYGNQ